MNESDKNLPQGLIEALVEASDILSGQAERREPLADELAGFAAMLRDGRDRREQARINADKPTPVQVAGADHIWADIIGTSFRRYYFSDETSEFHGPWLTQVEAEAQMAWYCKYILG